MVTLVKPKLVDYISRSEILFETDPTITKTTSQSLKGKQKPQRGRK